MIWDLHVHISGVDGKTPEERMAQLITIADRMGISVEGVKKHAQNARAKLGVHDKVGLALYALRMGALVMSPDGSTDDDSARG